MIPWDGASCSKGAVSKRFCEATSHTRRVLSAYTAASSVCPATFTVARSLTAEEFALDAKQVSSNRTDKPPSGVISRYAG